MARQFVKQNIKTVASDGRLRREVEILHTLRSAFHFSKLRVLKDLLSNIIKPYTSLIFPVILTMVAIFIFILTTMLSNGLKNRIKNESLSLAHQVESLLATAVPQDQWKVEKAYQDAHAKDAEQIVQLATQTTQRELLSYNIFPRPVDSSTLTFGAFGQKYCTGVENMLNRFKAGNCPSSIEIDRSLREIAGSTRNSRWFHRSNLNAAQEAIVDAICMDKAKSRSVYINPTDISGYEFWEDYEYTGRDKATEDCWYWQLGYWVIEDVLTTIDNMNTEYDNVLTSPVKRLLNISFVNEVNRSGRYIDATQPQYIVSSQGGLTNSFTGRKCNDDIDVIHFKMDTLVSAKAVLPFMKELCSGKEHKFKDFKGEGEERTFVHNQITILESSIEPIDRQGSTHKLYRYGNDAVVSLSLVCEYIFNKAGYEEIKPESIKEAVR